MEELFKTNQLHGLVDPGVADHLKRTLGVLAELRDLDQRAQTGGINEINLAQIEDDRQLIGLQHITDVINELLLRIRVQLTGEVKNQSTIKMLKTASKRDSQALKFADGTKPPTCSAKLR